MPARPAAGGDFLAHLLDVVRNFRDENHVGRAGESGVQRDEPRVAAHHLENDHAIVALGRGVELVDRFERGVHRGVEAEGRDRSAHIVVDRLRNADDLHPTLTELVGDCHRSVTANGNDGIDAELSSRPA